MRFYAGIGSRTVSTDMMETLSFVAGFLSKDWTLRSGGADGCDVAFENGCTGEKEIYLPWKGFNNNPSILHDPSDMARTIAKKYHPAWFKLTEVQKKFMARNVHQVLGSNCVTPVEFVVCWTPDGSEGKTTAKTGGTGQAIRIAHDLNIPIFNLKNKGSYNRLVDFIERF